MVSVERERRSSEGHVDVSIINDDKEDDNNKNDDTEDKQYNKKKREYKS